MFMYKSIYEHSISYLLGREKLLGYLTNPGLTLNKQTNKQTQNWVVFYWSGHTTLYFHLTTYLPKLKVLWLFLFSSQIGCLNIWWNDVKVHPSALGFTLLQVLGRCSPTELDILVSYLKYCCLPSYWFVKIYYVLWVKFFIMLMSSNIFLPSLLLITVWI